MTASDQLSGLPRSLGCEATPSSAAGDSGRLARVSVHRLQKRQCRDEESGRDPDHERDRGQSDRLRACPSQLHSAAEPQADCRSRDACSAEGACTHPRSDDRQALDQLLLREKDRRPDPYPGQGGHDEGRDRPSNQHPRADWTSSPVQRLRTLMRHGSTLTTPHITASHDRTTTPLRRPCALDHMFKVGVGRELWAVSRRTWQCP